MTRSGVFFSLFQAEKKAARAPPPAPAPVSNKSPVVAKKAKMLLQMPETSAPSPRKFPSVLMSGIFE
jgi:hypothetical protein